jgi:hypothetical protein
VHTYEDASELSMILSQLVGTMCAYPLLVISTCIRSGILQSSIKGFYSSFGIITALNGLGALWSGFIPYLVSRGVLNGAALLMDTGVEWVEDKLFPHKDTSTDRRRSQFDLLATVVKAAVCAAVVCPFEVIAFRMQASSITPNAKTAMVGCGLWGIKCIWQQRGVRAFFRGLAQDVMYYWFKGV